MSCNCDKPATAFGRFGAKVGDKAWNWSAKRIKGFTGVGDYNIVANSLINSNVDGGQPIVSTSGRETRIAYREYIGDVYTHPTTVGQFHLVQFKVNPGDAKTFPWLSGIAKHFEQYKPHGIIFEYRSTAPDNSATAALGSTMMASDYDVTDPVYTTKIEMMNSAYSNESKQSVDQVHGLECDPMELQRKMFYVSDGRPESSPRDYTIANFSIATLGGTLPANTSVGSLYVHYDFSFFKEQLPYTLLTNSRTWACADWNPNGLFNKLNGSNGVQTGNLNLGISLFSNGVAQEVIFQHDLSGQYIRLDAAYSGDPYTCVGNSEGVHVNCSTVQPTALLTPYVATTAPQILTDQNGLINITEASFTTFIKVGILQPGETAKYVFATLGVFPVGGAANDKVIMTATIINNPF